MVFDHKNRRHVLTNGLQKGISLFGMFRTRRSTVKTGEDVHEKDWQNDGKPLVVNFGAIGRTSFLYHFHLQSYGIIMNKLVGIINEQNWQKPDA